MDQDEGDENIVKVEASEEFGDSQLMYFGGGETGTQSMNDSSKKIHMLRRAHTHLLRSEVAQIESGDYEDIGESRSSLKCLQLENIIKKIGDKVIIDDLSLTCFRDEIFVLIGENGAGKTTILQSIAGNHSGLEGNIIAHNMDIKNGIRFLDDFIAF